MTSILGSIDDISSKKIIIGDFNAYLNTKLESKGGKLLKYLKILMRHLANKKSNFETFFFSTASFFRLYSKTIGFFFISNILQEEVKRTDILGAFSSDHSSIFLTYQKPITYLKAKAYGNLTVL